ncbi:hypothetical protein WMY93_023506 [Mugilogobius chulae]|uniref:Uncharacterized protein n=1 Tax=Mugilogobius chulae TaxID=88201 RepID=A0AAW0N9F9_9GOBI
MPRPGRNTYSDQKPPYSLHLSYRHGHPELSREDAASEFPGGRTSLGRGASGRCTRAAETCLRTGVFCVVEEIQSVRRADHLAPSKQSEAAHYLQQQAKLRLSALAATGTHLPQMSTYNLGVSQTSTFKHPFAIENIIAREYKVPGSLAFSTMQSMSAGYPCTTS